MFQTYKKLYGLFDARERRRMVLLLGLMIMVAFIEALGVASIMPFIAMLTNPEVVDTNPYLALDVRLVGVYVETDAFLRFLGLVFFVFLLASQALKATRTWATLRFSHNRNFRWGSRLVGGYLHQPYEWFLNRHSADLATAVLAEVNQVINGTLMPAMRVIAQGLVALFLLGLLVAADPFLSLVVGTVLGASFGLIQFVVKRRLQRIGMERRQANRRRFNVVQEAFGGIKDVKVSGLENTFLHRFQGPARTLASREISASLIAQMPKYALQTLLFGGMLLVLLYLMRTRGGFQDAAPIAALFGFGAYRLFPAIQMLYSEIVQIRYSAAALDSLCADFEKLELRPDASSRSASTGEADRIGLHRQLELDNVVYAYPGAPHAALQGVSLAISAFSTVGIVGSTGSGKTTMVDLILGLLRPHSGRLLVDGQELADELVRAWQRSVGYVPQQIFLSDDTVAANIAFGLPEPDIDLAAVERAAKVANLHDFVVNEMPDGYRTHVGERGVRLSGGQRQRIGIARALYHDPDLLILDEATSALDNITEHAVMEAVNNLGSRKTIVLIAHRLSTVKNCDRIFLLEHGKLLGQGTYEELIEMNESFRAMAEIV
jgi:ATP-binding cassette, subfamily B, bacterial PglK